MVDAFLLIGVFAVVLVVGYQLISRVPALLHTPLMSMTNAISAVTVLGALVLLAREGSAAEVALVAVALVTAGFNFVGGFAITDRMLRLFRHR